MMTHPYNPRHKNCSSCQEFAEMHNTESIINDMHKPHLERWQQ